MIAYVISNSKKESGSIHEHFTFHSMEMDTYREQSTLLDLNVMLVTLSVFGHTMPRSMLFASKIVAVSELVPFANEPMTGKPVELVLMAGSEMAEPLSSVVGVNESLDWLDSVVVVVFGVNVVVVNGVVDVVDVVLVVVGTVVDDSVGISSTSV